MISRTAQLHAALRDAAQRQLDFFPGYNGHPRGFGWHNGGEVPAAEQDALVVLEACRLIGLVPACVCRRVGAEVVLTPTGERVLSEWDAQVNGVQISPARGAGVQLRAGDTNQNGESHG